MQKLCTCEDYPVAEVIAFMLIVLYYFQIFNFLSLCFLKQNQDRKHRTYVYVLTVTETLEAWEDSVNIGTVSLHLLVNVCTCSCCGVCGLYVCSSETAGSPFKKYCIFLFMRSPLFCMETIWALGYAVTTGAHKSRPLILAAVVLHCSIQYINCQ